MTTDSPRHTPLVAVHRGLDATLTDFAGWSMPLRYSSERAEHLAVRERAGIFDLSHMGEITVTGPQAGQALDAAMIGSLSTIKPRRARYTMVCDAEGGILDDLIVYRTDDGSGGDSADATYLAVANASNAQTVLDALRERASGFDAEVRDDRETYALIAVQGPYAEQILLPLAPGAEARDAVRSLRYYACVPTVLAGYPVLLARTGYTGEDGFELFVTPEHAAPLWEAISQAGAEDGLTPAGLSCRDTLRLEAGMPLYGHELSADLTPFDAGQGRLVKFDKTTNGGAFTGREALAKAAEHTPGRRLVGLLSQGRRVPRAGYPVVDPADGTTVGEVTSGAPSPTLGKPIAMAYVDTAYTEAGTSLAVEVRRSHEATEVTALPFYKRGS